MQGVIARSHCKESLSHCKESLQGGIARSHCKESLQGVIARSHCKESLQGVMRVIASCAWSQVQVASARSQVQVASARSQVQVASAWSQVQVASARSQVQVASARSQVQLTCEELKPLLRAAGWCRRHYTKIDPLRGSAWSRCKNPWFFSISKVPARPSAGIGVVEVQKPMV